MDIEFEYERLLNALSAHQPGTKEYSEILAQSKKVHEMVLMQQAQLHKEKCELAKTSSKGPFGVSRDLYATSFGKLVGMTMIMVFEQNHVFRTKALSYLPKIRD